MAAPKDATSPRLLNDLGAHPSYARCLLHLAFRLLLNYILSSYRLQLSRSTTILGREHLDELSSPEASLPPTSRSSPH